MEEAQVQSQGELDPPLATTKEPSCHKENPKIPRATTKTQCSQINMFFFKKLNYKKEYSCSTLAIYSSKYSGCLFFPYKYSTREAQIWFKVFWLLKKMSTKLCFAMSLTVFTQKPPPTYPH